MAYNYYPYNANYTPYGANYQPANTPTMQNTVQNGIVWVQGETGAKSYFVAPNSNALLMDSEAERFYIKTVDASGMPLPLRVFEFKEVTEGKNAPQSAKVIEMPEYITREEFERRIEEIRKVKTDESTL